MDPEDDIGGYEDDYADELELMAEMDEDFPPVSKKSLHFTTPKHNHNIEKKLDNSPLPVLGELLSPEQSQAITNNVIENDAPKMRKVTNGRVVVEDELNFLESPKRKRRRISPNLAIDDDDFEITPPASPDADEKIMMKIKQHRQQKSCNFNTTLEPNETETRTLSRDVNHTTVHVLRRQPQGKHLTVTGHDGERVYVKVRDDDKLVDKTKIVVYGNRSDGSLQLLSTSIDVLREIIEEKRTNQLLEESQRISDELEREVNENRVIAKRDGNETKTGSLWVDKYGPQQYSELLSDDGTNRTLLRWLKLWDYVVYGKEYKPKEEKKKTTKPNMKKWGANVPEVVEELDEHKRPVHKVALLCGPPGLGKTTLAHVIAKHAGYNVIEMNASDDRSAEIFRTRIESATQMKSVLGPDQKPNCLIIDEIDGAPAPAINVLLSVIKRKDTAASAPEPSQFGIPGKKKKKKQTMLLRPIICICNDQFTPSLRQLRQQSLIVQFPPTLSTRLATRLNEIARNNYLKTDQTTLLALCQKAENDIRSCINTLQFIRGQFSQLTLQMINSMSIGQKDQHKGLFAVWNEIFQLPRVSKKRYLNPYDIQAVDGVAVIEEEVCETSPSARFNNVLHTVTANGEYDKTTQGIFDNFLEVKCKDPYMDAVILGHEWLAMSDRLNQEISHSQNYIFMRYLPFLPVAFHMLFASNSHRRIQYPNTQYENFVKLNKTLNLLTSLLSGVTPATKRNAHTKVAVLDILPLLVEIMQPNIRPVNTQLYSTKEKEQLCNVVSTMIAYNLTYQQRRSPEGQYTYCLEPNIEEVVKFGGLPVKKQMTYATKQLIAREIELEKMRRSEGVTTKENKEQKNPVEANTGDKKQQSTVPRHKEKLQPKKFDIVEDQPTRDFFGRIVKVPLKENTGEQESEAEENKKSKRNNCVLWYKFHEGYTNAIRRNIQIKDLL